jgi:ParB-like chromosome segregation protein Spo0J
MMRPELPLKLIPTAKIRKHVLNANLMPPEFKVKLKELIGREGRYPPLIVRPLVGTDDVELLDGEQRLDVLVELGAEEVWCCIWPCDDQEALILLATLNRLEGQDVPGRRAALIAELEAHASLAELAKLLPETEAELRQTRALLDFDIEALMGELTAQAERAAAESTVLFSFGVPPEDAEDVRAAVAAASEPLTGKNRNGRALASLARAFLSQSRRAD